jgi:hypothetical protein
MVKPSVKYTLVAVVVGLLIGYIVLGRYCNMERMEGGDAVAAAQKEWDYFVSIGFNEANAKDNPGANAALTKLNAAKGAAAGAGGGAPPAYGGGKVPVPPPSGSETAYIILALIGSLVGAILLVIFARYAFRSLSGPPAPPAYQPSPYGARRR